MRARILAVVLLAAFAAQSQAAYPEKPIRFVVPSASGGSVDVLMRILTQQLSAQMGVAFVVENKPGGSYVQVFNMLAVSNGLPVRTVAELIDYAKKTPGKLSNGASGNGTTGHLGGELFKTMTGTEMVHG